MSFKIVRELALSASALLLSTSANAEFITLEMHFSGASQGNNVRADGHLTIDVPIYAEGGFGVSTSDVKDFYMVVSGSRNSDGIFTESIQELWYGNYPGVVGFTSPTKLDFTKELVGQELPNGDHFFMPDEYDGMDQTIHNGGFWLSGPLSIFSMYYQQPSYHSGWNYENFELIRLESLRAVGYIPSAPIPEPETYAMLLAGLGLLGAIVRRRMQA